MIELLLALILGNGGTPHYSTLFWQSVVVTDSNADGTAFTRPALGYFVYRAPIINGVQGPWLLLNPDVLVIGMLDDNGLPADNQYEDDQVIEGITYIYAVSAVDFGGESLKSTVSNVVVTPINPNSPTGLAAK